MQLMFNALVEECARQVNMAGMGGSLQNGGVGISSATGGQDAEMRAAGLDPILIAKIACMREKGWAFTLTPR